VLEQYGLFDDDEVDDLEKEWDSDVGDSGWVFEPLAPFFFFFFFLLFFSFLGGRSKRRCSFR
jgi:hypothetical protein